MGGNKALVSTDRSECPDLGTKCAGPGFVAFPILFSDTESYTLDIVFRFRFFQSFRGTIPRRCLNQSLKDILVPAVHIHAGYIL